MPEFFAVCLTCDSDSSMTVDVNVHMMKTASCLMLSLFSPYWIINKTSRVLQYRADEVSVKHPADLRDIILFSFRKKNLFSKSKVRPTPGRLHSLHLCLQMDFTVKFSHKLGFGTHSGHTVFTVPESFGL